MPATIGMSSATSIPEGATLVSSYWAVPSHYLAGEPQESQIAALEFAITEKAKGRDRHRENYNAPNGNEPGYVPYPETMYVDLRWEMKYTGGGIDLTVMQHRYEDIADAQTHLELLKKFAHLGVRP